MKNFIIGLMFLTGLLTFANVSVNESSANSVNWSMSLSNESKNTSKLVFDNSESRDVRIVFESINRTVEVHTMGSNVCWYQGNVSTGDKGDNLNFSYLNESSNSVSSDEYYVTIINDGWWFWQHFNGSGKIFAN